MQNNGSSFEDSLSIVPSNSISFN